MEKNYEILQKDFEKLKNDFNTQLQELNKTKDLNEFHDFLVEILTKYPEQKDLIKFITYVNDMLSRNSQLFDDVLIESYNEFLEKQKILTQFLINHSKELKIKEQKNVAPVKKGKFSFLKNITIKDLKFFSGAFILTLILIILIFNPNLIDKLFTDIFKFLKVIFSTKI